MISPSRLMARGKLAWAQVPANGRGRLHSSALLSTTPARGATRAHLRRGVSNFPPDIRGTALWGRDGQSVCVLFSDLLFTLLGNYTWHANLDSRHRWGLLMLSHLGVSPEWQIATNRIVLCHGRAGLLPFVLVGFGLRQRTRAAGNTFPTYQVSSIPTRIPPKSAAIYGNAPEPSVGKAAEPGGGSLRRAKGGYLDAR